MEASPNADVSRVTDEYVQSLMKRRRELDESEDSKLEVRLNASVRNSSNGTPRLSFSRNEVESSQMSISENVVVGACQRLF